MSYRKVAWHFQAPSFNRKDPNLRVKDIIHQRMRSFGWTSDIVCSEQEILSGRYDAVIFCSVDEQCYKIIQTLKQQKTATFFHHMESIFTFPLQREIFQAVSGVICSSAALAIASERHQLGRCFHIDDPADDIFYQVDDKKPLSEIGWNVVYAGGSVHTAENYRGAVESAGWKFKVLTYPNDGRDYFREADDYNGNPYWWLPEYRDARVALCAHDVNMLPNKSAIKVITAFASGLVPVASPISSYRHAIKHGVNGLLFHSHADLTSALKWMKADPLNWGRLKIGGIKEADKYDSGTVAQSWMRLIEYFCDLC